MKTELLQDWSKKMFSRKKTHKGQTKLADGTFFTDVSVEPLPIEEILSLYECTLCLPYELSLLECAQIYLSIPNADCLNEIEVITKGDHGQEISQLHSPYDIYNFQNFIVQELPCSVPRTIEHEASGSLIYWDAHQEYCLIAGTKQFCQKSFPYTYELLERYYIESSMAEFENEDDARSCFVGLTSWMTK